MIRSSITNGLSPEVGNSTPPGLRVQGNAVYLRLKPEVIKIQALRAYFSEIY